MKATESRRIALPAAALGGDPAAFGAKPDGTAIDLVAEGTYNWQGEEDLGGQGLNGWIFALLTIDAVGAEVPADARYSRQDMLDAIVSAQLPDGGCYHQYQPLTKKGNSDIGGDFSDDPLWMILSVSAYIKETGDWGILDEMVPYDNDDSNA